jgi:beta-glucosidase
MSNIVATPTIKNPWLDRHEQFCAIVKSEAIDLLFLGDSITEGWASHGAETWSSHYARRKAANFGINGERIQNLLWRVINGSLDGISPKLIVLLIGTNNAARNSLADIIEGIQILLQEIMVRCPESKILLLAPFPRETEPVAERRRLVNDINGALELIAYPANIHFMNIAEAFLDSDGRLPTRLFPDGLHPVAEAYAIWAERIEPVVRQYVDGEN